MSNDKKKKELARIVAGRMSPGAPQQIDAVRSTTGQIKGFLTKDTLYRLRQAVADHQKAANENEALPRLGIILGLCDTYLNNHGSEKEARAREKVAMVEDMKAEASAERSRREAEAIYLQDAYAQATAEPGSKAYSATRMDDQTSSAYGTAGHQAKQLAQGKAHHIQEGFNQATLELIKKYSLTEAEVLAVKVYTASDYKYINPATANDKKWMTGQFPPKMAEELAAKKKEAEQEKQKAKDAAKGDGAKSPIEDREVEVSELLANESGEAAEDRVLDVAALADDTSSDDDRVAEISEFLETTPHEYFETDEGKLHLKRLFEEGSLHGALAISAVRKLPPAAGLCFRGTRLTEEMFAKTYGDANARKLPPPQTVRRLTSVATDAGEARKFADGKDCDDAKKTVCVFTYLTVKTGRDIGDLSILGRLEKEWLLLPGTVLVTDSVEELPNGNFGAPKATKWVVVQAHEQ
jgi:hypothetical protein